jgi:uncharacterized spore protein YtfJ
VTSLEWTQHTIEQARDAITVRRVYGDPIERDGTVLIPAADVRGGAGGGGGVDATGSLGGGSGFGLKARRVGAFVIRSDGDVEWVPIVDRQRELTIVTTVAVFTFLTVRVLTRCRRRSRR